MKVCDALRIKELLGSLYTAFPFAWFYYAWFRPLSSLEYALNVYRVLHAPVFPFNPSYYAIVTLVTYTNGTK
jgi:hypothetical protein